jgi:hypothetical protein
MNPSFESFVDEFLLIKRAEIDEPMDIPMPAGSHPVQDEEVRPHKSDLPFLVKERLKKVIPYALGVGVGTGGGYLLGDVLLPKVLSKYAPGSMSDRTLNVLRYGAGGLGALIAMQKAKTFAKAVKEENDALQRYRQGI